MLVAWSRDGLSGSVLLREVRVVILRHNICFTTAGLTALSFIFAMRLVSRLCVLAPVRVSCLRSHSGCGVFSLLVSDALRVARSCAVESEGLFCDPFVLWSGLPRRCLAGRVENVDQTVGACTTSTFSSFRFSLSVLRRSLRTRSSTESSTGLRRASPSHQLAVWPHRVTRFCDCRTASTATPLRRRMVILEMSTAG